MFKVAESSPTSKLELCSYFWLQLSSDDLRRVALEAAVPRAPHFLDAVLQRGEFPDPTPEISRQEVGSAVRLCRVVAILFVDLFLLSFRRNNS